MSEIFDPLGFLPASSNNAFQVLTQNKSETSICIDGGEEVEDLSWMMNTFYEIIEEIRPFFFTTGLTRKIDFELRREIGNSTVCLIDDHEDDLPQALQATVASGSPSYIGGIQSRPENPAELPDDLSLIRENRQKIRKLEGTLSKIKQQIYINRHPDQHPPVNYDLIDEPKLLPQITSPNNQSMITPQLINTQETWAKIPNRSPTILLNRTFYYTLSSIASNRDQVPLLTTPLAP
ncbi:uncharacterized protein L201_005030 [Kwoniella dendrophila CBS 6074]|uniref:Uncharacterized protein n=1 Tax=Kwoniella dendrophila CBS 6074 TaxID=1295534 RepID=A0AAX4JXW1_9TREE